MSNSADTVERQIQVGLRCVCGWGMYQTTNASLLCQNGACEFAGIEYEFPTVTLKRRETEPEAKQ